ncbi:MAG TPA: pilus assembly protein [Burkholderiales bacterium]|nr:pilus assembly protein [Burkholderiales bacterium]
MGHVSSPSRRLKLGGQGMMEYIIILALVVIAGIGAYSFFGQTFKQHDAGAAKDKSGKAAATDVPGAQKPAGQEPRKAAEPNDTGDAKSTAANK